MKISTHVARLSASAIALAAAAPLWAQSTGQQDFDKQTIVVTGSHQGQAVGGVTLPNTSRAKETLTQAVIGQQTPGQSVDDIINLLPGVSFQNNDGYGASGGTLNIRGFDASRVTQTWDGLPLNDTGNYAIYSNQQLDPELIDQVTVSLGSTDVDAPTAAATGSSVNYTTRNPYEDFHVQMRASFGEYNMMRVFGVVDTGVFTKAGTRAFIEASKENYENPFNNIGQLSKRQINAKVYQPVGSNGDFISIAGHWNHNINNFFGSAPLRTDLTQSPVNSAARTVGTGTTNRFPTDRDEAHYTFAPCSTGAGVAGRADTATTCGTAYDYRYNPSDTANARINSRFTLADNLVLTFDGGYEYTLANGGGTATAREGYYNAGTAAAPRLLSGYFGGAPYLGGVDLNGDGDTLDQVTVSAPSNTHTDRFLALVSLRYSITENHTIRAGYTLDYGRHRQTGEITTLQPDGFATYPFTSEHPIDDSAGNSIQKRDRLSYAILHQAFGEYRGQFFDQRLTVTAGLRAPFFTRDLNQNCFTTAGNGNVDCTSQNAAENATYAALHPYVVNATTGVPSGYATPQERILHYNKVLPEAGFVAEFTRNLSLFGNYSKGLQVPGTDNLYQSFYYPLGSADATPKAETSDNFDLGVRFKSGKVQAYVDGWYTNFQNRLQSSYDPVNSVTIYQNLGTVHKYGVDGSVSYQLLPQILVYGFGSYLKSKILDNVQSGGGSTFNCSGLSAADALFPTATNGVTATNAAFNNCNFTAGKRESGAPKYMFGGRVQANLGPLQVDLEAKRTGKRYVNDQNLPVLSTYTSGGRTYYYQVYGATAPAYTLVNLNARLALNWLGFNDRTFLQFNVYNMFNKYYVGGFGGLAPRTSTTFAQIGAPRTISGTFAIGF